MLMVSNNFYNLILTQVCPKFVGETCGIGFGRCLYSLVCMRDDPYSDQGTCQGNFIFNYDKELGIHFHVLFK